MNRLCLVLLMALMFPVFACRGEESDTRDSAEGLAEETAEVGQETPDATGGVVGQDDLGTYRERANSEDAQTIGEAWRFLSNHFRCLPWE